MKCSRVVALAVTHVVGEDIGDGHEDGVLGGGGGQVQPELQVTDRVAAQVLQLHNTTCDNIPNDLLLVFYCGDESWLNCRDFFLFLLSKTTRSRLSPRDELAGCSFFYPEVSVELRSDGL